MSKRAEDAALRALPKYPPEMYADEDEYIEVESDRSMQRVFYRKGYEQAEKDTIERAIQWLIANADDYIVDMEVSRYMPSKLIVGGMCWENLKKAMGEE